VNLVANEFRVKNGLIVGSLSVDSGGTLTIPDDIVHDGDTNNKIAFGTDTQSFQTGGTARFNISDSGLQIGTGARVTTINTSFSDNDTSLMTSQAIKEKIENYGYTTNTGDITAVTAGDGLTGGASSGGATLTVGAGTGVTVNANDVAIGQAVGTSDDVTFSTITIASDLIHSGDTNTKLGFSTDTITLTTGGTARLTLTDSAATINQAATFSGGIANAGTISAGTWSGTTIGVSKGGTGITSYSNGELLIGNSLGVLTAATLTAGDGIDVTNGNGAVTIAAETASATNPGVVELATTAETTTGTDAARAVTPDGLKDGYQGSTNVTTLGTISTGTWQGTAIDLENYVTGVLPSANLDADTAHLSGTQTFSGDKTFSGTVTIASDLIHSGDTNNKFTFGTDTQTFTTGGSSRVDISDSGLRLGGSGARVTTINTGFTDNDTSLMTSQAIKEKIESYGYTTVTGDITGVDLTGGTAITIGSETGTASGDYSATISVTDNTIGATQLNVSGNGDTSKFLRSDGDGTFSWAVPSGSGASELGALSDAVTGPTGDEAQRNVGLGENALDSITQFVSGIVTDGGKFNVGVGYDAGTAVTTGDNNTFVGYQAGAATTTGSSNVAIGLGALDGPDTESNNIAIGHNAYGGSVAGAEQGIAIGSSAGDAITSGDGNTMMGYQAMTAATTGSYNTAVGYQANYTGVTAGAKNTMIGFRAGKAVAGGGFNILIGANAGDNITSGSENVVIGSPDVSSATGDTQLSIGSGNATVTWITGTSNSLTAVQATTFSGGITDAGTIAAGTWNGGVIASAYLDSDTAHLSGTQTFSGSKTFSAKITADAGIDIDNFNIDGTTIALSSGDMTLDAAGDIILDAEGTDIILKQAGTNFGRFKRASGDFVIKADTNNEPMVFKGVDNSSTITALTLEMADAGAATFNAGVTIGGDLIIPDDIVHSGDTNNLISFGTDTQSFETGGTARFNISDSGLQIGTGARVTTILDEDDLSTDSATALATQQSIKAYVDAQSGGASSLNGLSDVTYSSGDLTISSLDTLIVGDFVIDSSGDISLDADGADIRLKDAGTTYGNLAHDSGHFKIKAVVNDADMYFVVKDNNSNVDALILDGSDAGAATFNAGVTIGGDLIIPDDIVHSGDTNNLISFGTDTQSFETGGTARFNISNSGLQIGTGARVTTILDEDNMATNSATALATQQSIKAYVDANAGGGGASALGDLSDAVTTATDNIGIGPSALDSISASNGNYNIGIGRDTGTSITTGDRNVCIGWNAGEDLVDVSDNVFVGALSGFNATGSSNTVVGTNAFRTATAGIDNVSIGKASMYSSAAGNYNVAVGSSAMYASTAGNNNVAVGKDALRAVTGNDNIGIGHDAGDNITSGSNNLVIGAFDVDTATGDDQIIIGSGDGGVTWLKGDSNGIKALKIKVKTVTGTETLTDAQSGSYVYVTGSGAPTLPATAESGQQFTIINNTGGNLTPGLGTSNAIATGWTAHAAMSDETARTYICVATNKWIYIG
jgi:hypothetical protein